MKYKLMMLGLIIIAGNTYAFNPNVSKKYILERDKKPDFVEPIETKKNLTYMLTSAYAYDKGYAADTFDRLARNIDEYNRLNNKVSNYVSRVEKHNYDDMDEVAVTFADGEISRYYFGNNNRAKDIRIVDSNKFSEELKQIKEKNGEKYYFKGDYINLYKLSEKKVENNTEEGRIGAAANRNPLGISVEEYKEFEKKGQKEKLAFLKEKLEKVLHELGYDIEIKEKNGELYTVDGEKERKIYWKVEPVTIPEPNPTSSKEPRKYYDDIYNEIYLHVNSIKTTSKWGIKSDKPINTLLYTKNGDIIAEENTSISNPIEFRGRGRIDGVVDLKNKKLNIQGKLTGKYGTSIILGPKAKLTNISEVIVGDDSVGGAESGAITTGITSLILDLDPSKKNEKGYLTGHAFTQSDKEIPFYSDSTNRNGEERNAFDLTLMISKLDNHSTIAAGRKLKYKDTSDRDMEIKMNSDSIAHTLRLKEEKDENGDSLLEVNLRKKIKRLSEEENDVYRSIANSNRISMLSNTLTSVNKRAIFQYKEVSKYKKKKETLGKYLMEGKGLNAIIKDLSEFELTDTEKKEMETYIATIQKSVQEKKKRDLEDKQLLETINFREKHIDNLKQELQAFIKEVKEKKTELNTKEQVERMLEKLQKGEYFGKYTSDNVLGTDFFGQILKDIEEVKKALQNNDLKRARAFLDLEESFEAAKEKMTIENMGYMYLKSDAEKRLKEPLELKEHGTDYALAYRRLRQLLYYNLRQEEALEEFKTMLTQLQQTNIYSKLNKIAKNEISTYVNLPFDLNRSLSTKPRYARGGFISARTVQNNFKGNIYTAYGLYEQVLDKNSRVGVIFGGSNTDHVLTHNKRSATTTPADSKAKGTSVYLGAYYGHKLYQELDWISGIGAQYGTYKIKRHLKNNYQSLESDGKGKVGALNSYTGLVLHYPLQEDVEVQVKGILSYSYVNQGKINENNGLNLDIQAKDYHYVDSEVGVSLNKTLYDFGVKSNLSGGISAITGISGYKNDDLKAKIHGSSSSFNIKGDKVKKDAVKLFLDYNVQMDAGFNYGLEGTYITNDDESNVKIGVKAGYTF